MKAILTVGIPASGKTTWAEEFCKNNSNWANINRDSIRRNMFGEDYKFSKAKEKQVTQQQEVEILTWSAVGANIIISDTNLNPGHRGVMEGFLESLGYEVEYKDFPIDLMEAIRRDAKRANGVGYEVIHRMWAKWLNYIDFERYIPNENLPETIIVDVDGTLADMKGRRGPFEWDKVDQDQRIDVIADMVDGYSRLDYNIIVLSGRDGSCEDLTRKWLDNNLFWYDELHMRAAGDMRKDSIIKSELFWEYVAPYYNVKAVIDDRPQVCRMWRDLGLKVIQVADPYKEF